MKLLPVATITLAILSLCHSQQDNEYCKDDDDCLHDPDYWNHLGHDWLDEKIPIVLNKGNTAKNIIIFVASGLSAATLTAARTAKGGEDQTFSFEKYPWSGHARTYCVDKQTPDSACAATAFLSGVKTNTGTINVSPKATRGDCTVSTADRLESIAKAALDAGKAVGFATTSRITSGVAPALYATAADKNWESNQNVVDSGCKTSDAEDIASQLVHGPIGKEFKVIFGGGRKHFLDVSITDEEGHPGVRTDGKNLIKEWQESKGSENGVYVTTNSELSSLNTSNIDYLMGIFESDRLQYNLDVVNNELADEPKLISLCHYSLEMLQKKEHSNGFVLLIEDSLINEAHKENKPNQALNEVLEFDSALNMAKMMVGSDTLIIVLSDVGSTLTYTGNGDIGSPLLGEAGLSDVDTIPYLKLQYANGPSHSQFYKSNGGRENPTEVLEKQPNIRDKIVSAGVPMQQTTNGAEDILIHATGPWAHLFSGSYEQSFIAHGIKYAACMDNYCSAASHVKMSLLALVITCMWHLLRLKQ